VQVFKKIFKYSLYGFFLLVLAAVSMMYMGGKKLRESRERLEVTAATAGFTSVEEYQSAVDNGYATKIEYDAFLEVVRAKEEVGVDAGGFTDISEYRLAAAVGIDTKELYDSHLAEQASPGASMSEQVDQADLPVAYEDDVALVLECTSAEGFQYFIMHENADTARIVNPPNQIMYPIRFETSPGYYTYSNSDLRKFYSGLEIDYFHIDRVDAELGFFSTSNYGVLGRLYSCVETSVESFAAAESAVKDADARRAREEEAEENRVKSNQKF